jgi:hypothetical protein
MFLANLGRIAPRECEGVFANPSAVIAREGGRSSIPETPVFESISRGVLVPRFRGDDERE